MIELTLKQKETLGLISHETYYSLDGFIYMEVDSSEVLDLVAMDKDVYILYDDDTESLFHEFIDSVDDNCTYGIEIGDVNELYRKALTMSINKNLGL